MIVDDSIPKVQRRTTPEVDRKPSGETKWTVLTQKVHSLHEEKDIVLSMYAAGRQEETAAIRFRLAAVSIPEGDEQPFGKSPLSVWAAALRLPTKRGCGHDGGRLSVMILGVTMQVASHFLITDHLC